MELHPDEVAHAHHIVMLDTGGSLQPVLFAIEVKMLQVL